MKFFHRYDEIFLFYMGNSSLYNTYLGVGVLPIWRGFMSNNSVLTRDYFKDNIETCNSLVYCTIPNIFYKLDSQSFYDWASCKYVVIPPCVKEIAEDAFLWDNLHLIISNHDFFQKKSFPFQVIPYISAEFSNSIVSLYEKMESIDSKVDIHSEEIAKKRAALNQEIDSVLHELEQKDSILQGKTKALEKKYTDLSHKSDDASEFIKSIKEKINTMVTTKVDEQLKRVEDECGKYQSLQKSEVEEAKESLKKMKTELQSVSSKEQKKLEKVKKDFELLTENVKEQMDELADDIAQKALEIAGKETPYKKITIVIDKKKIQSNKPKILHHQFEDVITLVSAGFNPLLVGPAGCGKNVIIEQVADTLGWKFFYVNDVTEEYKVMGFVDANGHYCKTQFYDAFTQGGFIMIDELDQSNAGALLAINSAIGTGYHEYASFPDGKLYPKHPDFHIAAAANTYGNGANMLYCGRNQLDVASLNRFTPIFINYDHDLESNLVSNQDFLPLYWKIRNIIQTNRIRQVISTRNIVNADKMISNHLFDLDKIFDFTITQGMSKEDLRIILNDLSKSRSTGSYENQFTNYLQKVKQISMKEY